LKLGRPVSAPERRSCNSKSDVGGGEMAEMREPGSEAELAERVRAAHASGESLELRGGGTRRDLGRPLRTDAILSLGGLRGVSYYEPGALMLAARAGTPLGEVEDALAREGQMLAFEPMDHRVLLGSKGEPTLGGVAACNVSGPRRVQAGACRDSLLAVRFVNGEGQAIGSGRRVMKNVTGYDLAKLLCGSWGTLGALTELCFKVLPRPERSATLALESLDVATAVAAMAKALGSPWEVAGAAHLPGRPTRTLLRLEGFADQVSYRLERLQALFKGISRDVIEGDAQGRLWRDVRDAALFAGCERPVWRLHLRPGDAPDVDAALRNELGAETFLDWGGGLTWARLPEPGNAAAEAVRDIVGRRGGHATLVRALEAVRSSVPVFHPQPARLRSLSQALRARFDPGGILNPGRMTA